MTVFLKKFKCHNFFSVPIFLALFFPIPTFFAALPLHRSIQAQSTIQHTHMETNREALI